jgi:hypothetical protein
MSYVSKIVAQLDFPPQFILKGLNPSVYRKALVVLLVIGLWQNIINW